MASKRRRRLHATSRMLTVRDIVSLPGLGLELAAGATGADNPIRWVHVSELPDPTQWLEGGELLITTGLGVGELSRPQREYVRRLAGHGLAGLAFGIGFGWAEPPAALADEAERLDFPLVTVPYEVPFIALTKAISSRLANAQLARLERALEVHERLAHSVLQGQGAPALLAILGDHIGCALALVDEAGRVVGERHSARLVGCEHVLELPVVADGETWSLRAGKPRDELSEYDRLVLHHGQSALAFELSRRHAVSAAELRLAGDLLEDLEHDRLDEREISRRIAAFGLDPQSRYAALLAVATGAPPGDEVRTAAARVLDSRGARYLSASRRDRAAFLVATDLEEDALAIARELVEAAPGTRVGVGRPASGAGLGRSLLEARAALDAVAGPVASYQDLGSLELLLGLPAAALEAFVARVLGPASGNAWLLESLAALLDSGCRWSDAADRLGVHRHTLRYRMDQLRKQTGRHPDDPAQRMELWLAVKAKQAIAAREAEPAAV
ncbi:MAG TPA: PucR family transcriptional regulator ligand-binding domain-containing protein [Gaiellaceae bacterium]|nr:PucR family transcriptional regulator ligand-binding domain-containing protein [Gaiellaceae bacterium]